MAGTKIVTRKLVDFQGRDEEFSNTYYFGDGSAGLSPSEADATAIINAVIEAEKTVFGNAVRFLGGAAYKVGIADAPGDTDAISVVELAASGNNGGVVASTTMYRECAVDLKFLLGGRRYLRSLLHLCASHGYGVTGGGTPTGVAALSTELKAFAERMLNGPWPAGYQRIAPNGDRPTVVQYNPFMEHRQFHRYRRRNAGILS